MPIQIIVDQPTLAYLESNKGVLSVEAFAAILLEYAVRMKTNRPATQKEDRESPAAEQ